MKKIIKNFGTISIVSMLIVIVALLIMINLEGYKPMKYKGETELFSTFYENESLFLETATILKGSSIFNVKLQDMGDSALRGPYDKYFYEVFSSDEIDTLNEFFNTVKPLIIKGMPNGIQFQFLVKNGFLKQKYYSIYYLYDGEYYDIQSAIYYIQQYGRKVCPLKDDMWFYVEW